MPAWAAWTVLIIGFGLPVLHVLLSRRGGPFTPPPGSGCPLGPRVGWLVIVLFAGPVGWGLYLRGRARQARVPPAGRSPPPGRPGGDAPAPPGASP